MPRRINQLRAFAAQCFGGQRGRVVAMRKRAGQGGRLGARAQRRGYSARSWLMVSAHFSTRWPLSLIKWRGTPFLSMMYCPAKFHAGSGLPAERGKLWSHFQTASFLEQHVLDFGVHEVDVSAVHQLLLTLHLAN